MSEPEFIDPNQLRPGPIRHSSLQPELLERIRMVHEVIGSYLGMPLEQFEIGFMRDMSPESEVAIWCKITAAWIAYHEQYLNDELQSDEQEKKLLGALLAISTGIHDADALGVPEEAGRNLIACYNGLANP